MRVSPLLRSLPPALVLGVGLLVAPVSGPERVGAVGPLPECRLDDILTEPRDYDDWSITLVDWILTVGSDYKPTDLVSVRDAGVNGSGLVRKVAFDDLAAMARAARANGTPLVSWSAYRSYDQQVKLFNGYAGKDGSNFHNAITFSARPGHSEHQLGLTIDFVGVGDTGLTSNWEVTRTGGWMARNAWKYGWLMSYPKGAQDVACYRYEPWHYRYVGRDLAAKIHESGLTIREYLWANYTQVDPECAALPGPSIGVEPSPRECPLPTPTPTPTPTPAPTAAPTGSASPASPGSQTPGSPPPPTVAPSTPEAPLAALGPAALAIVLLVAAVAAYAAWRNVTRRRVRSG